MPLIADAEYFAESIRQLAEWARPRKPDLVLGAEARGFIFGGALAYELGAGFVAARKPGKLPWETVEATYALEYGTDSLQVHRDAIAAGRARDRPRRRARDRRHGQGEGASSSSSSAATVVGRRSSSSSSTFLNGRDKLAGLRRALADPVLASHPHRGMRRPAAGYNENCVRPVDEHVLVLVPASGEARVPLSSFRTLERLPGAVASGRVSASSSPAGAARSIRAHLRTTTSTGAPLGLGERPDVPERADRPRRLRRPRSSADLAATRIGAGEWPWSFFCYLEDGPRPMTPSAFARRSPAARAEDAFARRGSLPRLLDGVGQPRLAASMSTSRSGTTRASGRGSRLRRDAVRALADFRAELESAQLRREETRSRALTRRADDRFHSRQGSAARTGAADVAHMSAAVLTKVAPAGSPRLLADVNALDGQDAEAGSPPSTGSKPRSVATSPTGSSPLSASSEAHSLRALTARTSRGLRGRDRPRV